LYLPIVNRIDGFCQSDVEMEF